MFLCFLTRIECFVTTCADKFVKYGLMVSSLVANEAGGMLVCLFANVACICCMVCLCLPVIEVYLVNIVCREGE
jgi:hypothetical protein